MGRYRVAKAPKGWPSTLPFRVGWEGHPFDYGVGDEFTRDFTPGEEADNLASGLLELVPQKYRVLLGRVFEHDQGQTFHAALRIEQEAHLINGGFIERVDDSGEKKARK